MGMEIDPTTDRITMSEDDLKALVAVVLSSCTEAIKEAATTIVNEIDTSRPSRARVNPNPTSEEIAAELRYAIEAHHNARAAWPTWREIQRRTAYRLPNAESAKSVLAEMVVDGRVQTSPLTQARNGKPIVRYRVTIEPAQLP